jgi:hypothetical protein
MINYISVGSDCSPATALRILGIRKFALPFDWVVSPIKALEACFSNNFKQYHTGLYYNSTKTRLIDVYGFEFPHSYPTIIQDIGEPEEGGFGENCIVENWMDYHKDVLCKYERRIERFLNIMNNPEPVIVVCRHYTSDVLKLQQLFIKYYNKENIYFVNSSREVFENDKIININTEKNGEWNELKIWKSGIDTIILKNNL